MDKNPVITGGCLCGAIRYETTALPFDSDYCHCSTCRKGTGGLTTAWIDFKTEQVRWITGQPKEFHSSDHIRRGFCDQCGTSLTYRHKDYPGYTTISTGSMDDPNVFQPTYHIYTNDAVSWLNIEDDCKRYPAHRTPDK